MSELVRELSKRPKVTLKPLEGSRAQMRVKHLLKNMSKIVLTSKQTKTFWPWHKALHFAHHQRLEDWSGMKTGWMELYTAQLLKKTFQSARDNLASYFQSYHQDRFITQNLVKGEVKNLWQALKFAAQRRSTSNVTKHYIYK